MSVKTVIHLFLADLRRLRWLLAAAAVALIIDVIPPLFAGPWKFAGRSGSWSGNLPAEYSATFGWHSALFVFAGWLLASSAGWSGIAEARVRPVRRREIAAGKLLFLCLIWLPQAAALLFVFRVNGVAWPDAWISLAACAGVFVPLWLTALLSGRIAGSFWRWLALFGLFLALCSFASLFKRGFLVSIEIAGDAWGSYCGPLAWIFLSSLAAALLLLLWCSRRWRRPVKIVAASVLMLAACVVWRGLDWFKFSGDDLGSLSSAELSSVQPQPADASFKAQLVFRDSKAFVSPAMAFTTTGLPPGVFCFWQCTGDAALLRNGEKAAGTQPRANQNGRVNVSWLFPPAGTPMDNASLMAALPEGVQLKKAAPQWNPFEKTPAQFPELNIEDGITLQPGESVSLEAALTGILYRHQLLADLPLTGTQSLSIGGMNLYVRRLDIPKRTLPSADVSIVCSTPGWAADPLRLNWRLSPFMAWRVFLYLPKSGAMLAEEGNNLLQRSGPVLGGAAVHRRIFGFDGDFSERRYMPEDAEGARLLILAPKLLGVVNRTVRTVEAPLELNTSQLGDLDFYYTLGPALAPRDFMQWARPRRPDPATATEEQFGEWLRIVLGQRALDDWQAAELAQWVPRSLETLLRMRPHSTGWEHPWTEAVILALPESRKAEIIRRVPEDESMVPILFHRGWMEEARRELIQLFRSGRARHPITIHAIATLRDPALYDELLARLERDGDQELMLQLRRIPELKPRVAEVIRRQHARITIHGKEPPGIPSHNDELRFGWFTPATRAGVEEALADQLAIYRWLRRDGMTRDYLSERLSGYIELPAGLKPRSKEACDFYFNLKPEQCRWDEFTSRWLTHTDKPSKP